LPQPGRQPVEIQEPRGLLVATKRSLVQFREKLGIGIHYGHFWTLVPVVEATVLNNVRKSFDSGLDLGGSWSFRTKYETKVRLVELSTTVPTRQANNLKVYLVKR